MSVFQCVPTGTWRGSLWVGLLSLSLLAASGDAAPKGKSGKSGKDQAVAEMGDVRLTGDALNKLLANLAPEDLQKLKANPRAMRKLVTEELVRLYLIRQARQDGWDNKPDIKYLMNRASEEILFNQYLLSRITPDSGFPAESMVQEVYDKNKSRLVNPDRVHLGQIFLALGNEEGAAANLENKLAEVRNRLSSDDFAEVAKQVSDHKESAANGGDMGWQEMGSIGPELRPVIAGLKVGEVSQPLKSERGWHILKLKERESGKAMSLEEARPAIVNSLRTSMAKNKEGIFLEETLTRTPPTIHDEVLSTVVGK
ncbi:MAG: hypothetical protein G8345_14595 [Magnetococcales bacterium]|nr:peptidylprolyl isomerase [Magnetococcales bacterium]NGZ28105.1 hypothetical protein [Magnetococcales bacterium]